ncbi:hypothetical protein HDV05_002917 [Chytridiales sp. JEL 0842]|nr:hypothetical protein HDV05_002917 [Chytridiales sp. JEL 0842]
MKQVYDFYAQKTTDEALDFLKGILSLDDSERSGILLDLYYYTLTFAKENKFSPEKASAFFSIIKETHANCTASPFIQMDKDYAFFKNLVLMHSVHRPPFSDKIFSFSDLKLVTDYAINTYFRHYLMYKYVFTKKVKLDFAIENAVEPVLVSASSTVDVDALGNPGVEIQSENMDGENTQDPQQAPVNGEAGSTDTNSTEEPAVVPAVSAVEPTPPSKPSSKPTSTRVSVSQLQPTLDPTAAGSTSDPLPNPEPENVEQSKHDAALQQLKQFILSTLSPALVDLKASLVGKIQAQEESLSARLKKIEMEEVQGVAGGKKEVKGKKGK